MTPEQRSLAEHRIARAEQTLQEADHELARGDYSLATNRAYYAIFYAQRAFLATIGKDSSRHSGILSMFNEHFINTGHVTEITGKMIQRLMDLRHEGDYHDFAVINKEEAGNAVQIVRDTLPLLKIRLQELCQINSGF